MFDKSTDFNINNQIEGISILIPNRQKLIDLIIFYLGLNTIDKNQNYSISIFYRESYEKSHEFIDNLSYTDLDELTYILKNPNIVNLNLVYESVAYEFLNPNVKNNMIDNHLEHFSWKRNIETSRPTLEDAGPIYDSISIYFKDSNISEPNPYDLYINKEDFEYSASGDNTFIFKINPSIGTPQSHMFYNIDNINKEFQDLRINMELFLNIMKSEYFILTYSKLYERFEIVTCSLKDSLKSIGKIKGFDYIKNNEDEWTQYRSNDFVYVSYIGNSHENLDGKPNPLKNYLSNDEIEKDKILHSLTKGSYRQSFKEYENLVEELSKLDIFDDCDFFVRTQLILNINYENRDYLAYFKVVKDDEKLKFYLDVPHSVKDYAVKKLGK